jgi:hypothetical protein
MSKMITTMTLCHDVIVKSYLYYWLDIFFKKGHTWSASPRVGQFAARRTIPLGGTNFPSWISTRRLNRIHTCLKWFYRRCCG